MQLRFAAINIQRPVGKNPHPWVEGHSILDLHKPQHFPLDPTNLAWQTLLVLCHSLAPSPHAAQGIYMGKIYVVVKLPGSDHAALSLVTFGGCFGGRICKLDSSEVYFKCFLLL